MSKLICVSAAACISLTAPVLAETYVVDNWPADIDTIPCSAWQRSGDGTWVLTGTIKVGASEVANVGVKGDAAARALERRCGKK